MTAQFRAFNERRQCKVSLRAGAIATAEPLGTHGLEGTHAPLYWLAAGACCRQNAYHSPPGCLADVVPSSALSTSGAGRWHQYLPPGLEKRLLMPDCRVFLVLCCVFLFCGLFFCFVCVGVLVCFFVCLVFCCCFLFVWFESLRVRNHR